MTNRQLEALLRHRVNCESVKSLAERYGLSPTQVAGLLHKYKARLRQMYLAMGMLPPRHGGKRKGSGRKKCENPMPLVDYHAVYLNTAEEETTTLTCLGCRREFESEDKCKNRFCKDCKSLHVWREGSDFSTHPMLSRIRTDFDPV